jgi:voltage-gated potassium channel
MLAVKDFLNRDKYRVLLGCIVAMVFVEPLITNVKVSHYVTLGLISLILITGAYAVRGNRNHLISAIVLLLPTLVLVWLDVPLKNESVIIISRTSPILMFLYIAVLIFKDLLRTRKVDADLIAGGISVYLLIGLIFALIYQAHFMLDPGSFVISKQLTEISNLEEARQRLHLFAYFSYVTMTTLGYGDITPLAEHTRILVQVETLLGQLYVAIFIARLVSIQTATRMKKE